MSLLNSLLDTRKALIGAGLALSMAFTAPTALADFGGWQTAGFAAQPTLQQTLSDLLAAGTDIREMASTANGGWVIITDTDQDVLWGGPVPSTAIAKIFEYIQSGREIDCVAFTPDDSWVVIADDLAWHSGSISYVVEMEAAILDRIAAGKKLTELVFDSDGDGWTLLSNDGGWAKSHGMPADLYAAVLERHAHKRTIQRIQMDFDRNWVLMAEDWFASSGINSTAFQWIKDFQRKQRSLDNIMLGPGGAWVLFSHGAFNFDLNQGIDSIEYELKGLHPDGSNVSNIWQRMEDLNVAGVSMGVIENGRLRWARSYGELEAGTQRFARSTSPFDAASLSKTVAATLAMNLMDDPQVPVFLDGNVKYYALAGPVIYWNDLLLWALYGGGFKPDPLPFMAITLRRCLSHSAAMLPHGSTSFKPGEVPPTTLEILFGKKYVNGDVTYGGSSMPWYQEDLFSDGGSWQPGETYKYSGGGFMVAQAMMEAITGGDFRTMAQDRILNPLQMDDTTFAAPLPPAFASRAAVAHDDGGQPIAVNQRKFYPWAAAGGMWTTPTDLAQVVLALLGSGTNQDLGVQLMQPLSAQQMMTKQTPVGVGTRYGLGLSLSANMVDSVNDEWFAHSGGHAEAATYLAGSPGRGEGIVIMINGGGDAGAEVLRSELYATFKDFYDWD